MLPVLLLLAPAAEAPPSPLRLIPDKAEVLFHVVKPREIAENATGHKLWARFTSFPAVKEQMEGTSFRRARQLLGYFERSLGGKWPELLDDVAGGGIAFGSKLGNNQPGLFVMQGRDEKKQQAFLERLLEAAVTEKVKPARGEIEGVPVWSIGENFFVARVGAALVASNKREALKASLDLAAGKGGKSLAEHPDLAELAKLLPEETQARLWINMRPVQASPEGKRAYADPRDDFLQTVVIGSYLSVLGRTPFVCAGLVPEKKGFRVSFRAPRGLEGMGSDRYLHAPTGKGKLRALLEPPGTVYSLSFWFDFAGIWEHRDKLFNAMQKKGLEDADRNPGTRAVTGTNLSTLLTSAGAAHRFLVVNQPKAGYKKQPQSMIPAFAFVGELRDAKKGGRAIDAALRTAGAFSALNLRFIRKEEKVGGATIHGYRYSEKEAAPGDPTDFRFNFSPCWVQVNDQFVFCTTFELAKELVPILQKEKEVYKVIAEGRAVDKVYPEGVAKLLEAQLDVLVTQTILDQAVPPAEARKQVKEFIKLVRSVGGAGTKVVIGKKTWRFDLWVGVE